MGHRVYRRAYATVRFTGPDLDPLEVTKALRLPPDHQHRDGEPRLIRTKKGKVEERAACRGGLWLMSSENRVDSPRLEIHLEWLLQQLEPLATAIHRLTGQGVTVDFFCFSVGATDHPPSLPRSIRDRAATLGIDIAIDHYRV